MTPEEEEIAADRPGDRGALLIGMGLGLVCGLAIQWVGALLFSVYGVIGAPIVAAVVAVALAESTPRPAPAWGFGIGCALELVVTFTVYTAFH